MLKKPAIFVAFLLSFWVTIVRAQQSDSLSGKPMAVPTKLLSRIGQKTTALNGQLTSQTVHYLKQMQRQEARLQSRLRGVDSAGAERLFGSSSNTYASLETRIKTDTGRKGQGFSGGYPAYLDSLQGSTAFLQQHPQYLSGATASQLAKLQTTTSQLQSLQAKMNDADAAKIFVQQRRQQISQYLADHTNVQGLLGKGFNDMSRQTYYYGQQLRAYKEMWNNPDQLEQKALILLNRLPAFQTFMKENSMLGGLFHLPGNYAAPQAISGLQTKIQVASLVQGQVSAGGAGGEAAMQSKLQSAQSQLDGYKSKLSQLGTGNGQMDLPDFKPNDQKTKTFLKRLEYGFDFQTSRTNYYFPTVSDFGLSIGYKLGHSNVVGIGASYKLGWGNGIQHIALSSQGVGLRSFLQIAIKHGFSATGGFEYNYTTPFVSYQQLKELQYWTKSGLIGLTKTVSMKSQVLKKTSVSLLWDFLSYQQVPKTQPFLFRIGYNF